MLIKGPVYKCLIAACFFVTWASLFSNKYLLNPTHTATMEAQAPTYTSPIYFHSLLTVWMQQGVESPEYFQGIVVYIST